MEPIWLSLLLVSISLCVSNDSSSQLFWWYELLKSVKLRRWSIPLSRLTLWWKPQKTRTWTHMVTARGFSELMPFNTSSGNRIGCYISREWITGQVVGILSLKPLIPLKISSSTMPIQIKKISLERYQEPTYHYYGCDRTRKIFPCTDYL